MLPLIVVGVVVLLLVVIGVIVWDVLRAVDHTAAWVLTTDGFPRETEHGLVGGLLVSIQFGSLLLFTAGVAVAVYLMGTNGVLWALAGIVVVIDLIFLCLSIIPGLEVRERKGEMIRNFAGNRVMFLLNMCSLGFFGIVATFVYCLGWLPSMVGPWTYASVAIEISVAGVCATFIESYDDNPSRHDWSMRSAVFYFLLRNLMIITLAMFVLVVVAVGFAPSANTYVHFMTPDPGETIGFWTEVFAIVAATVVFAITAPTAPIWIPFYYFGFGGGVLLIFAVALGVIACGILIGIFDEFSEIDKSAKTS